MKPAEGPFEIYRVAQDHYEIRKHPETGNSIRVASFRGPDAEANARLFAAVPDLLDQLEKVAEWLDRLEVAANRMAAETKGRFESLHEANVADAKNWRDTSIKIKAAIAKAKVE